MWASLTFLFHEISHFIPTQPQQSDTADFTETLEKPKGINACERSHTLIVNYGFTIV